MENLEFFLTNILDFLRSEPRISFTKSSLPPFLPILLPTRKENRCLLDHVGMRSLPKCRLLFMAFHNVSFSRNVLFHKKKVQN